MPCADVLSQSRFRPQALIQRWKRSQNSFDAGINLSMQPLRGICGVFKETLFQEPIVEEDAPSLVMTHQSEMMPAVVTRNKVVRRLGVR
jgi:hypothetical protein